MASEYAPLQRNSQKELSAVPWASKVLSPIRAHWERLWSFWWAWEVWSAFFALAATVALIIVLQQADGRQQQSLAIGVTQLTLNTTVAIISTMIRAALLVMVTGALHQSPWNWFARNKNGKGADDGRPLKDMDLLAEAAVSSWGSLKVLWRTKFR